MEKKEILANAKKLLKSQVDFFCTLDDDTFQDLSQMSETAATVELAKAIHTAVGLLYA